MSSEDKYTKKEAGGISIRVRTKYGLKTVGYVDGKVYQKELKNSGVLCFPEAVALSPDELDQAKQAGALSLRVVLLDRGETRAIELDRFLRFSFLVSRGFGSQRGCCLDRFDVVGQIAPRSALLDNPRGGFGAGEYHRPLFEQLPLFRPLDAGGNFRG